jgi:enamine deaminase RidA (YjgF/YER057c/UK114 family)
MKIVHLGAGALAGILLAVPALGFAAPALFAIERFFTLTAGGSLPSDPFLANGVATGAGTALYTAAGTGPAAKNTLAPSGTPAAFIDYDVIAMIDPDFAPSDADKAAGILPAGMTLTQAQGLNCMARVQENLEAADLTLADITFMRIFLDNPPEAARADYAGWNNAYRKFMANLDLNTGAPIPAYEPVIYPNKTRPARSNIEVATLPALGWLIEIEVVAAYPKEKPKWW